MAVGSSRAELGAACLDSAGALVDIDELGARMLGFTSPRECLGALGGEPFATDVETRATVTVAAAARRFVAECRGAGGRTRRFELYAGGGGRALRVLMAPSPREEGVGGASSQEGLIGALPNPVFVKDAQHRWLILNDRFCRLIGRPREELLGRSDFDVFPPSEAEVLWSRDDRVFTTGETDEHEESITDASGQEHVILTRKSLHRDGRGRPILLGVITDVTELKQAGDALRRSRDALDRRVAERTGELARANAQLLRNAVERRRAEDLLSASEERFGHLADALPQIVWTATPGGEIDYINSRGSEYAGAPLEDGLRYGWLRFVHPDDRSRVIERWEHSVRSGEVYECEYRLRRHDGLYRWHLVRALPLPGRSGGVIRWFGTATDIEDQKRAQQAMQEEDQRKNDFLAMLSHELRNPLTPVRNATHILRRAAVSGQPEVARAVTIVERQVTLMARLIDDLLDLSRITRGKIVLHKERFDVVSLVRTLLDDRRESLDEEGLRLEASLPRRPLLVEGDAARVAQAIGNLLENAQKYTGRGGEVRVEVGAEGGAAVVSVHDTGIGLSPAARERIFTPFVQVDSAAAGRRGGLGLGLSLVKSLAELHGGSVEARSEGEGRGSTFVFRLPLAADRAHESPAPAAPASDASGPRPTGRRVLVVEDNPDAAESLQLMLQLDGYEVETAATGEEAIARAREKRPDVIICDIGLPGMSGYEVARALRADPVAHAHLVAVTGYGQPQDREKALRSGFEHHLTKPFDHDHLQRLLADLSPA